jgi:hypothetical protein
MQMTTAIGAKNGLLCAKTSVATSHAMAAATEHCRIGSAISRNR